MELSKKREKYVSTRYFNRLADHYRFRLKKIIDKKDKLNGYADNYEKWDSKILVRNELIKARLLEEELYIILWKKDKFILTVNWVFMILFFLLWLGGFSDISHWLYTRIGYWSVVLIFFIFMGFGVYLQTIISNSIDKKYKKFEKKIKKGIEESVSHVKDDNKLFY